MIEYENICPRCEMAYGRIQKDCSECGSHE